MAVSAERPTNRVHINYLGRMNNLHLLNIQLITQPAWIGRSYCCARGGRQGDEAEVETV